MTSGCFGDQTFSKSLINEAGESTATNGGMSGGVRSSHFVAQWTFASASPFAKQPGLSVVMSPDRGDGARMSWLQMAEAADHSGLQLAFYDDQRGATVDPLNCCPPFVGNVIKKGLSRARKHTVTLVMDFKDGPSNDKVWVLLGKRIIWTGTSWEDFFRDNDDDQDGDDTDDDHDGPDHDGGDRDDDDGRR